MIAGLEPVLRDGLRTLCAGASFERTSAKKASGSRRLRELQGMFRGAVVRTQVSQEISEPGSEWYVARVYSGVKLAGTGNAQP